MARAKIKPLSAAFPILAAICVFLGGVGLATLFVGQAVQKAREETLRQVYPGRSDFFVAQPGRFTLWNHSVSFFQGTLYRTDQQLSPEDVLITGPAGEVIPLVPGLAAEKRTGGDTAGAVGTFTATEPGPHRMEVAGEMAPRVLSVAPEKARPIATLLARAAAALLGGFGLALAVWLLLWHLRRRSLSTPPPLPAAAPLPPSLPESGNAPPASDS